MTAYAIAVVLAAAAGWFAVPPEAGGLRRLDAAAPGRSPSAGDGGWQGLARSSVSARTRPRALPGRRSSPTSLDAETGELFSGLAAGLATGAAPREVLAEVAGDLLLLRPVAAAARSPGGDVPAALRTLGAGPGGHWLADLALVWSVSETAGAPLAAPVARLGAAHRADVALRRELAAQLAGPRATARLLALLPVAGLLLGSGLGGDPLRFLGGTAPGRLCLVAGVALVGAGLLWTRAIVRSALPSAVSAGRSALRST